jgi:hypothetical protein
MARHADPVAKKNKTGETQKNVQVKVQWFY